MLILCVEARAGAREVVGQSQGKPGEEEMSGASPQVMLYPSAIEVSIG